MVLTLRKRQDKSRKRKDQKDGGSSGSEDGNVGDDMQSDEEVHVEGGTAWGGPIDRGDRGDDRECEPSDGIAEAAAAAAFAAANQKYAVYMEPSPSCLPAWASGSLEQQNITSFGALQEEIAGLSFKLIDWDERTRTAQDKNIKNAAQLTVHDVASSKAALHDDRAFHIEAAAHQRTELEYATSSFCSSTHISLMHQPNSFDRHARRLASARAPVRALLKDEQAAVKLELRFAEEMTLQCVPLPLGRRFFCPIVKCSTHLTFGFACTDSLRTHMSLVHGTSLGEFDFFCVAAVRLFDVFLEAYAAAHGWEQLALLHSLGSLINHTVAAATPAQAMRAQSQSVSAAGSPTDAIMLERRRRGICLLIEHMNEHARERAERRVCRQRLRQQRADRLAAAVALCERWAASEPHAPHVITILSEALSIANNQHEVRENVLLRSGCFSHIRLSLEAGTEAHQQLALALVRALCTSRHNRRELRRAGVIPPLVMLLLPVVAVQQQAGAAAALLALVQGDRVSCGTNFAKACNVPNLRLLADHPDAVTRLEAVSSGGKTGGNFLGASLQGSMSNAGSNIYSGAAKHDSAGTAVVLTDTIKPRDVAASGEIMSAFSGGADALCMEAAVKDSIHEHAFTSAGTSAHAAAVCKKDHVDTAAASSAAAAFAAADAAAILSLLRFTLPQALTARSKSGGVIHSDPDAVAPPLPGESSGASHTSRYRRAPTYLQQLLRFCAMLM
jgi:hypothetical protein